MTMTSRVLRYARRYPGQSATQIANALRARPSTVSGMLQKAWRRCELDRLDFSGPRGGNGYGPCGWAADEARRAVQARRGYVHVSIPVSP